MTYNAGNSQCHTCCSWYIMALNEKAWNMMDDRGVNDALVIYTECFWIQLVSYYPLLLTCCYWCIAGCFGLHL